MMHINNRHFYKVFSNYFLHLFSLLTIYISLGNLNVFGQTVDCTDKTDREVVFELAARNGQQISVSAYEFPNGTIWDELQETKDWEGVTVDPDDETKVTGLYLSGFGLTSRLPVSLGCLQDLDSLDLSGNSLRDTIPASFGEMQSLIYMDISDNFLSGRIPNSIFENLTNLAYLDLSNNWQADEDPSSGITGQIATTLNTNKLAILRLSNNKLGGRIPNALGDIESLEVIDLGDTKGQNRTEGNTFSSLPEQVNWPDLEVITINNNDLGSEIPLTLWNSEKLRIVNLSRNKLTGSLPAILIGLSQLNTLFLHQNQLSGNISEIDEAITNIVDINLSDNQFAGAIPASFGQLTILENLILNKNELSDISLVDFTSMVNLRELNISENSIEDLPEDLQLTPSLNVLQLQSNKLTFEDFLPSNILAIDSVNGIYAPQDSIGVESIIEINIGDDTKISYEVDTSLPEINPATYAWYKDDNALGIPTTAISEIEIIDAQLADEGFYNFQSTHPDVSQLTLVSRKIELRVETPCEANDKGVIIDLYNSTDGANWTRPWDLKDELSTLEGVTSDEATGCMVKLEVDDQALNGIIPNEIGNISNLEKLLFTRNPSLIGTIPGDISMLANLEELVISSTGIDSFAASTIEPLANLKILRLKDNQLNDLPDLSGMTQLQTFEVDLNQLTFEDIIPNLTVLTSYAPQDSIGNADNPVLEVGDSYIYELPRFDEDLTNQYQWYKDGAPLTNARNLELINLKLIDSGEYYCVITNEQVPDLQLVTRKVTLEVREDCKVLDYDALKNIYDDTDGLNWVWNDPGRAWDFSTPNNIDMSNWEGVTVNEDGCVVGLRLNNKGMNGQLPDELGELINLDTLVISGNINLTGKIPNTIGLLNNLTYLDISSNSISEEIPAAIGDLRLLTFLALNNNNLSGELPQSIGQLQVLKKLILSNNLANGNGLSGAIPMAIGDLVELDTFFANQNKFSGEIPDEIGLLTNLKLLDFSDNQFDGDLPQGLFGLPNLEVLNLATNNFQGNIPDGLGNLSNLKELSLRDNAFTGTLPPSLTSLPLTRLLVNNNQLDAIGDVSGLPITALVIVSDNMLTFDDILTFTDVLDTYAPQDSVGTAQIQQIVVGQDYTFDLGIDEGVTTNEYTWKKDGVIIDFTNQNSYTIADATIDDAGTYTCEVKNPGADALTLISREFILTTDGVGGNDFEILGDSLACISSLKSYEVLNSSGNGIWSLNPSEAGQIFTGTQTKTDILWIGLGDIELTFTDNESSESVTKVITIVDAFTPPSVEFDPIIVINEPFEDIIAMGAPDAQFFWYFNGDEIATGETFNPEDVRVNGFSTDVAGFFDFEVVQQNPNGSCRSEPRLFRLRIVQESLPMPEDLIADEEDGSVRLEWSFSEPTAADSVVIERSVNGTENFEVIDIIAYEGINEYLDNSMLEEGVIYSYRIRMADFENDQVSPYSNIASVEIGGVDINNPPAVADINKTGKAGLEITFQISDFVNAFSDPDNDTLVSITILTLPENGELLLNNIPVTQNQVINKDELNGLSFIADIDFSGVASFTYTASDGEDVAITAANVFITITEVVEPEAADLTVSATGNPLDVNLGGEINFSISLLNNGESVARNFTLEVYLSSDSVISGEDIPVFSASLDSLSPGQNLNQEQVLAIPPDFPPGTYVVIFLIDADQTVAETNEENNVAFLEIIIREIVQAPIIPNIITPNGDLINDFLEIENLAQFPENTLTVLDKWGNEVFATGNYQNTWAGIDSDGQILPAGNYMIILTVLGENAATYTEVLTLIKE